MTGAGDSTNGGDLGEEDRRLPSSEQDEAASEQGRLASLDSPTEGSESVSMLFLLHLDWPQARKPLANGLLSIFSFVMRSFWGERNNKINDYLNKTSEVSFWRLFIKKNVVKHVQKTIIGWMFYP